MRVYDAVVSCWYESKDCHQSAVSSIHPGTDSDVGAAATAALLVLLQIDQNCMAGVLSMKDVVKVLLDDQKHEIDSLKDYIHGSW